MSYLAIFFVFYWEFFKNPHKHAVSQLQKGLIVALPVAYLVQGIAIFDVFPMYLMLVRVPRVRRVLFLGP